MKQGRLLVMAVLVAGCVDLSKPPSLERITDATGGGRDQGGPRFDGSMGGSPGGDATVAADMESPPPGVDAPAPGDDAPVVMVDAGEGVSVDTGPPDLPLTANGRPCDQGAQCASGSCSQGVCCNRDCNAPCFACNLMGALGTCFPVPGGEDPGNHCKQDEAASCALDGTCDGAGGCRRYQAGTECAPGRCENAREFAASTCDGAGMCKAGQSRACVGGICMGNTCASSCSNQDQCQAGFFCDNARCAAKRMTGAACTDNAQCTSAFCVDGVCCSSQCGQMCYACNVEGSVGSCTAVPSMQDPRKQCPAEAGTTCGRAGGCNGSGGCRLHPPGTMCAASSCTGVTETLARTCNGLGVCPPAGSKECFPHLCGPGACATSCASSDECQPGAACVGPSCVRAPGLVLYWRLEEPQAGTQALDSSGNNFHGMYVGSTGIPAASMVLPPLIKYPNTSSRAFITANRQAIRLAGTPAALRPANNVTVSVWFRASGTDASGGTATGAELVSVGNNYLVRLRGNPVGVEFSKRPVGGGASIQCRMPTAAATDGNWHHMAGISSATEGVKVYFDGVLRCALDRREDISYTGSGAGPDVFVGRHANSEDQWDFGGNIDEVRIYNRVLTEPEVMALAQGRN
jgi:hypothetical protein